MIVAFLDSNVLISALVGSANSTPVVLVDWLAGSSAASLITGRCCIQEVERNLARKLPQAPAAVGEISDRWRNTNRPMSPSIDRRHQRQGRGHCIRAAAAARNGLIHHFVYH